MEFVIQPEVVRHERLTFFDGAVSVVQAEQFTQVEPIPIRLIRPVLKETPPDPPPLEIVDALSRLKLYRLQEQAHLEASAGEYEQASEHLSRLAIHLLAQGERALAKTALLEAENLQKRKSFSQQGEKEIKYGTRALLKSGRIGKEE
jgi:Ca-activated chloride channel family protein